MPSRLALFAGLGWAALFVATIVIPERIVFNDTATTKIYTNTPVGINFVGLGYGYTAGEVGFDASIPIEDAKVHVHSGFLAYARSLDVWGLSGKVLAALPIAETSGSAKVAGQGRDRDVFGSLIRCSGLRQSLRRSRALDGGLPTYQQDIIVGVSLQVTAPWQYDPNKLLNVGTNRWSFKPEFGVSKAWGRLILEVIPAITFFTKNDDFLNGRPSSRIPFTLYRATSSMSSSRRSGPHSTPPTTSAGAPPSTTRRVNSWRMYVWA
jgi:hypothetical protein